MKFSVESGLVPVALSFNPVLVKPKKTIDNIKITETINIGNAGIFKSENVGNQDALLNISVPLVDAIPSLLHGPPKLSKLLLHFLQSKDLSLQISHEH